MVKCENGRTTISGPRALVLAEFTSLMKRMLEATSTKEVQAAIALAFGYPYSEIEKMIEEGVIK